MWPGIESGCRRGRCESQDLSWHVNCRKLPFPRRPHTCISSIPRSSELLTVRGYEGPIIFIKVVLAPDDAASIPRLHLFAQGTLQHRLTSKYSTVQSTSYCSPLLCDCTEYNFRWFSSSTCAHRHVIRSTGEHRPSAPEVFSLTPTRAQYENTTS